MSEPETTENGQWLGTFLDALVEQANGSGVGNLMGHEITRDEMQESLERVRDGNKNPFNALDFMSAQVLERIQ